MLRVVMFVVLASLIAPATQLDPTLTPQKSPKPTLPKIDRNACPFEGCQFGKWTAVQPVPIYSTWHKNRTLLRSLAKGEAATALTGINITFEPAEIRVTAPMPQYSLKPGDTVFAYMNIGEGFFSAWFNGTWVGEFDGSTIEGPGDSGCRRNCTGKFLKPGRSEWWVQIETKDGTLAWTKDGDKFDGTDALGGSY